MMCYKDLKIYHTISGQRLFTTLSWKWAHVVQPSNFSMATIALFSLLRFHNNQNFLTYYANNYINNYYYSILFARAPKSQSFWFKISPFSQINRQISL